LSFNRVELANLFGFVKGFVGIRGFVLKHEPLADVKMCLTWDIAILLAVRAL